MDLLDVKSVSFLECRSLPKDEYNVGALKVVDVIMNTTLAKIQTEWKHKSVKYYQ